MKKLLIIPIVVLVCAAITKVSQNSYSQQMKKESSVKYSPAMAMPETTRAKVVERRFQRDTSMIQQQINSVKDSLFSELSTTEELTEKRENTVSLQKKNRQALLETKELIQQLKVKLIVDKQDLPDITVIRPKQDPEPLKPAIDPDSKAKHVHPDSIRVEIRKRNFFDFIKFWK